MSLTHTAVRDYLDFHRISLRAVAPRLGIDPSHLHRILAGQRAARPGLLQSIMEVAETLHGKARPEEDLQNLIDAATHVFFLKRGVFQSNILRDAKNHKGEETQC